MITRMGPEYSRRAAFGEPPDRIDTTQGGCAPVVALNEGVQFDLRGAGRAGAST